jgi:hypothetical protein
MERPKAARLEERSIIKRTVKWVMGLSLKEIFTVSVIQVF